MKKVSALYTCQIKRNRETRKKRAIGGKTIRDGNSFLIVWSAHCEIMLYCPTKKIRVTRIAHAYAVNRVNII